MIEEIGDESAIGP